MKQKVILISGLLKSGKSTLAHQIFWQLNQMAMDYDDGGFLYSQVFQYAFASKVKEIAREQFGWDGKKDEKGRRLLQLVGTEVGRGYNKDIWVDYFSDYMNSKSKNTEGDAPAVFIVDDWRFENEVDNIKFDGDGSVYKVRVYRDSVERDESQLEHASENGLPRNRSYYDFNFVNAYKTIEDLRNSNQFLDIMAEIREFIKN